MPPHCHGDPPNPSCCCRRGWGAEPPPGFRSGAGSDGRARKQLSPRRGRSKCHPGHLAPRAGLVPVLSPAVGPPFPSGTSRGGRGQHPQSGGGAKRTGEHQHRWGPRMGDRDGGVTGVAGGDTAPTLYLGASTAPPAAQMSPRASRSGYRLRLQLPFIAPVPVPCPCPLPIAHRPPGGDTGVRAPQDTASDQGRPTPDTGTGDGGDPAATLAGLVTHRGCPGLAPVAGCPPTPPG